MSVRVGIDPTKALAKLANHIAKTEREFKGVGDRVSMSSFARFLPITSSKSLGFVNSYAGSLDA